MRTITLRRIWCHACLMAVAAVVGGALGWWGSDTVIPCIYFPIFFSAHLTLVLHMTPPTPEHP